MEGSVRWTRTTCVPHVGKEGGKRFLLKKPTHKPNFFVLSEKQTSVFCAWEKMHTVGILVRMWDRRPDLVVDLTTVHPNSATGRLVWGRAATFLKNKGEQKKPRECRLVWASARLDQAKYKKHDFWVYFLNWPLFFLKKVPRITWVSLKGKILRGSGLDLAFFSHFCGI